MAEHGPQPFRGFLALGSAQFSSSFEAFSVRNGCEMAALSCFKGLLRGEMSMQKEIRFAGTYGAAFCAVKRRP